MVDFLLDDVKELLLKGKGDEKILERIKRAAERGEVVSVYERDYIQKLVDEHLRPTPKDDDKPVENKIKEISKPSFEKPTLKKTGTKSEFNINSNPKTTKMIFGIAAAALAIILVVGVSQSELPDFDSGSSPAPKPVSGLVVDTDSSSYKISDIVSISGTSETKSGEVVLTITNPSGTLIWTENVKVKSSGAYATLVIAGGPGWETGEYTLKGVHGSLDSEMTFDIKS